MWIDWIKDETSVFNLEDDPQKMIDLYERALSDYKYYKVCKKYCKFIL
jgi:hypothetical protein